MPLPIPFSTIRQLYTPQAVVLRLKQLDTLESTVVDRFFKRKVNHPLDKVGKHDLMKLIQAMPLILRGGASLPVGGEPTSVEEYEPFEVAVHDLFTAADLHRWRLLDQTGMEQQAANLDDVLRRTCRTTAEGIGSTALTGKTSWPVALANGTLELYEVDFGAPLSHAPAKSWDAADMTIRLIFNDLQKMKTRIKQAGYGSKVVFWAGEDVYNLLLAVAETYQDNPKAKLRVDVSEKGISVGGFIVELMDETYYDPQTKTQQPKVPGSKLLAWAEDAPHTLFYCALDDINAKLQPLPYYSKPVELADPSGVKIIGRSKPFPVPITKAMCWATVIFGG